MAEAQEKTLSPKEIEDQKKRDNQLRWRKTTEYAAVVVAIDIAILVIGVVLQNYNINLGWTIAAIGIITFFGMLSVSSYHKKDSPEGDQGTMRDALTASLISAYFAVLAFSMFEKITSGNTAVDSLLSSFSSVITIVVAFYFGSKGAVEIYKYKADTQNKSKKHQNRRQGSIPRKSFLPSL